MLQKFLLCLGSLATLVLPLSAAIDSKAIWPVQSPPSGTNPATFAVPRQDWVVRVQSSLDRTRGKRYELIFDGDSITDGWQSAGKEVFSEFFGNRQAFDFGISGDKIEHLLWRLEQGQVDGLNPKLVVLMIGTNNSGRDSADQIAQGIGRVTEEYLKRCPEAQVLLLGVFPRGELATDPARAKIAEINRQIASLASPRVQFMDIGPKFLQENGRISKEIMPDFLHPSAKGYRIWAQAIQPVVEKALGIDTLAPHTQNFTNGSAIKVVKCYPKGLMRAYCVSFDDGRLAFDKPVLESLRKRKIPATFFVNSLNPQSQEALENAKAYQGFEVASHGAHHSGLINMPLAQAQEEVTQDQKILSDRFHTKVEGFAYPYGAIPKDPLPFEAWLKKAGILYARGTGATGMFRPPQDFIRWDPDCGFFSSQNLDKYLNTPAEDSVRVLMEFGHSVDFTDGRMSFQEWEKYLDRIAKEKSLWKQSMSGLTHYVSALRSLAFSEKGIVNQAEIPVWIRANGRAMEVPAGSTIAWTRVQGI